MIKKGTLFLLSAAATLAACHSPVYNQTMGNVADVKIKATQARKLSDAQAKPLPALVVRQGHYVDTTPISLARAPSWLQNHIVIRGDQLPFSYYTRTVADGARRDVLAKYQPGMDQTIALSMNYSGTIKGALDLIATKTGYTYTIQRNTIYWQAFVTRTFDIAFMPGAADYLLGKKSGGGGSTAAQSSGGQVQNFVSSDSSDSEYSNFGAKISLWEDLETTIKQMLSPDGKVNVSQATTTVTVRDRPAFVQAISQYIYNLNNKLSKQVLIKIQVLEVNLENTYDFGINWQLIARSFARNSNYILNGNYGTPISITAFTPQNIPIGGAAVTSTTPPLSTPQLGLQGNGTVPSYTVLLNALNQQGHTSVVSEPRVVSLNNQVSVVRIVTQNGYVASVENTTNVGGGTGGNNQNATVTSQITPGNLITGLTLYVLPKILGDKIYLQVNADLSTNNGFTTGTGAGSLVQLPNITEKHFNQRSMIRSGDTLILSGMRQTTNIANANQFLTSQALGGKGSTQLNKETIVLITPIILNGNA